MLGLQGVVLGRPQTSGQFVNDIPEDNAVDVLPQHVEEEPIAHLGPSNDRVDGFSVYQPEPHPQQANPHPWTKDDYYPDTKYNNV